MNRSVNLRLAFGFGRITILILVAPFVDSVAHAQNARQLAQNTFPSVVLLVMQDANGQPVSLGSGFFVNDGIIATNLHVVRGASTGKAKLVGQTNTYAISDLVAVDADSDLVLLKVPGAEAQKLPLGKSDELAVGDVVYAIGNPEGLEGTFSQGIVSGIRSIGVNKLLQVTAPISPGSSGGPIIDNSGDVVGVAVATFSEGQNLNFAIPVSYLAALLRNMGNPRPLSSVKEVQESAKPTANIFGERSIEGVVGVGFKWTDTISYAAGFSFIFRNQLRSAVKDIRYLVVFFGGDGKPVDYLEGHTCHETILPKLAKWQSLTAFSHESTMPVIGDCFPLMVNREVKGITRHVEIRVLDFKLAN